MVFFRHYLTVPFHIPGKDIRDFYFNPLIGEDGENGTKTEVTSLKSCNVSQSEFYLGTATSTNKKVLLGKPVTERRVLYIF